MPSPADWNESHADWCARVFAPEHSNRMWCGVCFMSSDHPDHVGMGVWGVDGQFFCSMECHDSVECHRAAEVWNMSRPDSDNRFGAHVGQWVACRGPQAHIDFRCPDCDHRRNS